MHLLYTYLKLKLYIREGARNNNNKNINKKYFFFIFSNMDVLFIPPAPFNSPLFHF